MKFVVRIRKKHLRQLVEQLPEVEPQRIFELAVELGLAQLTAAGRGLAPKA